MRIITQTFVTAEIGYRRFVVQTVVVVLNEVGREYLSGRIILLCSLVENQFTFDQIPAG